MTSRFLLISFCNTGGEMLDVSLGCYDLLEHSFHYLNFNGYPGASNFFDMGCTGVCVDDSSNFYVSIQSLTPRILVFNKFGSYVKEIIISAAKDLHDLKFNDNKLLVASTGNNRLYSIDLHRDGLVTEIMAFDDCDSDIVHFNSFLNCSNGDTLFCFTANKIKESIGSVANTNKTVIDNLNFPHSLFEISDCYVVLDSMNSKIVFFDKCNFNILHELQLFGFLRGVCVVDNILYVGRCSLRLDSRKNPNSKIFNFDIEESRCGFYRIDINNFTEIDFIDLTDYGYEIYEIIPHNYLDSFNLHIDSRLFSIFRKRKRIMQLENYLNSAMTVKASD